jgi:hypothetical protein
MSAWAWSEIIFPSAKETPMTNDKPEPVFPAPLTSERLEQIREVLVNVPLTFAPLSASEWWQKSEQFRALALELLGEVERGRFR